MDPWYKIWPHRNENGEERLGGVGRFLRVQVLRKRRFHQWPAKVKVKAKEAARRKVDVHGLTHDLIDTVQSRLTAQGYYLINHSEPEEISIISKFLELWLYMRGIEFE